MHYLSCCRYSYNIFWAFQTACSGLKFSIQSYCLLFFLSSFPQNQYVDSLNSLQQAAYHIYTTSSHCLSSPISVSLVTEESTSALIQSGCYTSCTYPPTHTEFQRVEIWSRHTCFWRDICLGDIYCTSFCCGSDRMCVCDFYSETEHLNFSQALGLMNGSEFLLGHSTKKWWGGTHPLVLAPCHLMARLQIHRWIKFYLSASTFLDPRDRKVCLNYLRSHLVSTEVFLLAYFEVFYVLIIGLIPHLKVPFVIVTPLCPTNSA